MASYWHNLQKTINSSGKFMMSTTAPNLSMNNKVASTALKSLHLSAKQEYPQAKPLPLPINIDPNESQRFSPQRTRDITSTAIATSIWNQRSIDITIDSSQSYDVKSTADPHVDSYDCTGAVSLNSSMQSNVPSPFGGMHKFTHLNMPGGQWSQSNKWMSHDLHSSHYTNLRREARKDWSNASLNNGSIKKGMTEPTQNVPLHGNYPTVYKTVWNQVLKSYLLNAPFACSKQNHCKDHLVSIPHHINHRMFSDKKEIVKSISTDNVNDELQKENEQAAPVDTLTARQKLKKAIKDYGATVLIFHITISLASLGFFYQLVSSGLDMVAILEYIGMSSTSSTISNDVASGASTFVVAYAVHKIFAPFRISITLLTAPFIVRYLRNRGILVAKKTSKKP